jgi:hypothetical protein
MSNHKKICRYPACKSNLFLPFIVLTLPQPDHGYPSRFLGRSRQAAALADLAERCAGEARGEGPEGVTLAGQFESLQRQLADEKAAAGSW